MARLFPVALFAIPLAAFVAASASAQDRPAAKPSSSSPTPAASSSSPVAPTGSAVAPGTPAPDALSPPSIKSHVEAVYPPDALKDRIEGNVGLELTLDEQGNVADARVTTPAGHGFDEAAVVAAKQFHFEPARRGTIAIRSSVQFTYEFHLPPPPPAPVPPVPPVLTPPTAAPSPAEVTQQGQDQSTLVLAARPISAASSSTVRDRDFALRPIGSVQDILRVTPGLIMVQHSGGGKANQYFLRGFDADHGTDIALSIDGVPINLPSHAHGQGFSDTNFIIPEVVERVEITKGPYFVNQGDFATAGAVNMVSRDSFEHSSVGFGLSGSPGHGALGYRGLLIASPEIGNNLKATFAAEAGRSNGPFDNPENWDKYKLFNKLAYAISPTSSISIGEMSYGSSWYGSGQIPARAVEQGLISRFGSIDPNEGGNTARHQLFAHYQLRPDDHSEIKVLAYVGTYRFNLHSNFTLYLVDPENGDEIEQIDRRTFYGGKVSYRVVHEVGGVKLDTTIGADTRSDDIHEELWHTRNRVELSQIRGNNVHETLMGTYFNEEISPTSWLRLDAGGRGDLLSFAVDNTLATADKSNPRSGFNAAHQLSPKADIIVSPLQTEDAQLDFYVNYGHGYHSNDVRGAFASPAVTPLARAIGEETGSRARLFDRLDMAVAFWRLDLASETTWNGDDGTTGVAGPTRRYGVELESRYELTKWLAADGAITFTHSAFTEDHGNANGLALAPKQTWSGGLSARHELGPGVARGGLRFYGIGDRPASDDGAIVAPGFTQFDLHTGYRTRRFDIAFDVENLFNQVFRSAQFDTISRLRTEPAVGANVPSGFNCGSNGRLAPNPNGGPSNGKFYGCEDVNYTPAYPLTLRIMGTIYLD